MERIPAKTGWLWVKEGFALFRRQPMELSTLFLCYMFMMLGIGIIPLAGEVLPLLLTPVFSMAFMQACVQVERGERVYPGTLLAGFRSPAFRKLAMLGVFYLIAAIIAIAASAVVDGGQFWKIITGQIPLNEDTVRDSNISLAMMFSAAVWIPASMAFWYAPPLIMWNGMGVGKAMFYSFFSVKKAALAFIVYGLAWFLVGGMLPTIVASLTALVLGQAMAVTVILAPTLLVMTVVLYCSFYPTYTCIFGKRQDTPASVPSP
jgi:hypothetical protein